MAGDANTNTATNYQDRTGTVTRASEVAPGRKTFSITTVLDDETGRLYLLAKAMGMAVASVYRHNLTIFIELLREENRRLESDKVGARKLKDAARLLSGSHIVRNEGLPDGADICDWLEVAGKPELARYVAELPLVGLALLVDRARHMMAFPNEPEWSRCPGHVQVQNGAVQDPHAAPRDAHSATE